jgi:hypothetical protein
MATSNNFMSRFNPFQGGPRTPQASQQREQGPANQSFQAGNGMPPGTPGNPAQTGQPQAPANPMDQFNSVFGLGNQQQQQPQQGQQLPQQMPPQQQQPQAPEYNGYTQPFDIAAARQRMSNVNFSSNMPKDLRDRVAAGDGGAFIEALDMMGRESFLHATQMAHSFVDRGVKTGLDRFGTGLDERFRDYEIRQQNPDNEMLQHPTVAPMFNAMKQMIASQNPGMSAAEVNKTAQNFFTQMSSAMAPQQPAAGNSQNAPKETDWMSSFQMEDSSAAGQQGAQQQQQPPGDFTPRGF